MCSVVYKCRVLFKRSVSLKSVYFTVCNVSDLLVSVQYAVCSIQGKLYSV